jgi:hypothetical protein
MLAPVLGERAKLVHAAGEVVACSLEVREARQARPL